MKFRKNFFLSLILVALLSTTTALAEIEHSALYDSWRGGMSQSGFLSQSFTLRYDDYGNPYYLAGSFHWYDYETGIALLACSRLECSHTESVLTFDNRTIPERMDDTSVCYASRLSESSLIDLVMYGGKIYGLSIFPNLFTEAHEIDLYELELDGPTKRVASLGNLFSWEQYLVDTEMLIYNGCAYLNFSISKNPNLDIERSEALGDVPPLSIIYKVSLENGQATELCRISAQNCDYRLMGLVDDVLYFYQQCADGYTPREKAASFEAWRDEYEEKNRYSLLGVNVANGETVVLDDDLCDLTLAYGTKFELIKDNQLYAIILPQTAEEKNARFVRYDLEKRTCTLDYSFAYDADNRFVPYYVLTDTTVLAFNFETGEFALHNLDSGEIKVLDIPGACIYGNEGEYYDISSVECQPEVLLFDHYDADGRLTVAYMTIEELLNNEMPHDFDMLE